MYRGPGLWRKARHERHIHLAGDRNDSKMESFNGGVREREGVMRSIKQRDSPIIDGMWIHHNTRPCIGLDGKSPCDRVGLVIKGDNKWVALIQNAEKARIESRAKMMRCNGDKKSGNLYKAPKGEKPTNTGHDKYPEPGAACTLNGVPGHAQFSSCLPWRQTRPSVLRRPDGACSDDAVKPSAFLPGRLFAAALAHSPQRGAKGRLPPHQKRKANVHDGGAGRARLPCEKYIPEKWRRNNA